MYGFDLSTELAGSADLQMWQIKEWKAAGIALPTTTSMQRERGDSPSPVIAGIREIGLVQKKAPAIKVTLMDGTSFVCGESQEFFDDSGWVRPGAGIVLRAYGKHTGSIRDSWPVEVDSVTDGLELDLYLPSIYGRDNVVLANRLVARLPLPDNLKGVIADLATGR